MRLKNLLNYFDTLDEEEPCGRITYSRVCNKDYLNSNKINQAIVKKRLQLKKRFTIVKNVLQL
jgi:hypothetical protein